MLPDDLKNLRHEPLMDLNISDGGVFVILTAIFSLALILERAGILR